MRIQRLTTLARAVWALPILLGVVSALTACAPPPDTSAGSSGQTAAENQASGELATTSEPNTLRPQPSTELAEVVELTVADLAQLEETVKSHAGKVVVVDVWSTSCAPCMREFPHLVGLSQNNPEHLACISLNVDYIGLKSKPPEFYSAKVREFLQQQHAQHITNLLSASADEAVLSQYKLTSIPAILIYAADGTLQHALTDANTGDDGLTYEGDVIPKVESLLATLP